MNESTVAASPSPARSAAPLPYPGFAEALRTWTRIALLSFGGPAGQIAVMHRILVEEKRWLGEARFLHALNFCMLLPGPEAQQLAVYVGWLMHRTLGGIVAGVLFVLPGLLAIMALSVVYVVYGNVPVVEGLFFGLKAAVLAIVLQAVLRIGRRALRNNVMVGIAAASFVAIYGFDVPFPIIVAAAALVGFLGGRAGHPAFRPGSGHGSVGASHVADAETVLGTEVPAHARPDRSWSLKVSAILLALWLLPTALLVAALGFDNVFSQIGVFFSQMAVVTFGGAYAVLAYVAQAAVGTYGWLEPGEMLDGLGMAETTPGPLIMVTQFVGFLAAYREAGGFSPLTAGVLGGLLTTWVTFAPCFLWIFLGAPYIERLRENRALSAALAAVTAAVVGVILNLAIWFGLHVLFEETTSYRRFGLDVDVPVLTSLDPVSALIAAAAVVALTRLRLGAAPVLAGCALVGIGLAVLT
ncbi:chromate efflux transporter [Lutibaculum baratangense]|uniref:Chromate transport protein ChrA n=1 Tax=Lutibaculum baratangense AMV1 TaxID=631454 RepID=V4RD81_9HYPH|nr:chromate efflux transporter [Lutibaculum baratangense]ESR24106.1 Chromate transport protein ChrA [Lutibaculum baratangense AMV1]